MKKIFSIAILLIGIYMIWQFSGNTPPLLSGIAFILLGLKDLLK